MSEPEPKAPESASTSSGTLDALGKYLSDKLNLGEKEEAPKPEILNSFTLDGIVEYIKEKDCKKIITLAGAGISTAAGIPDFRTPGSGLYDNLQKYNLPNPESIFDINFFKENPQPFFELAKELYPGKFEPTVSHYFIKLLQEKGVLLRHYSQNIDTLERVAGIDAELLVEAHGTFYTGHCLECKEEYTLEWMKERIFKDEIPICSSCPGVVKPDIIFFSENLPKRFFKCIHDDFKQCDLLIIMGSSLAVQPFASLINLVPPNCPRLLINREKVGRKSTLMSMLGIGEDGLLFDTKQNIRDVAYLGDCDAGCILLAEKLGWGDDLKVVQKGEVEVPSEPEAKDNSDQISAPETNTLKDSFKSASSSTEAETKSSL